MATEVLRILSPLNWQSKEIKTCVPGRYSHTRVCSHLYTHTHILRIFLYIIIRISIKLTVSSCWHFQLTEDSRCLYHAEDSRRLPPRIYKAHPNRKKPVTHHQSPDTRRAASELLPSPPPDTAFGAGLQWQTDPSAFRLTDAVPVLRYCLLPPLPSLSLQGGCFIHL